MSHGLARVASTIRLVVSDAISNRIWDPRVHHFTSVTRVEVTPDLKFADVHVSVMGTETESRTTLQGLQSARGMIQTRLARKIRSRQCPTLRFHLDRGIKVGIENLRKLDQITAQAQSGAVRNANAAEPEAASGPIEGVLNGNNGATNSGAIS